MKPFDLEAAKAGKPIVNSSGAAYRFIAHIPEAISSARVILFPVNDAKTSNAVFCGENGETSYPCGKFLMAPEEHTMKFQIVRNKATKEIRAVGWRHDVNNEWEILARDIDVTFTEGQNL